MGDMNGKPVEVREGNIKKNTNPGPTAEDVANRPPAPRSQMPSPWIKEMYYGDAGAVFGHSKGAPRMGDDMRGSLRAVALLNKIEASSDRTEQIDMLSNALDVAKCDGAQTVRQEIAKKAWSKRASSLAQGITWLTLMAILPWLWKALCWYWHLVVSL